MWHTVLNGSSLVIAPLERRGRVRSGPVRKVGVPEAQLFEHSLGRNVGVADQRKAVLVQVG